MKAAIIGATGYGGAELIRILHQHKYITAYSLYSSTQAGLKIAESYRQLTQLSDHVLQEIAVDKLATEADIIFIAAPSGVSTELTPALVNYGAKIIDLSGDFRFSNQTIYEKWYKKKAAPASVLQTAIYGLSEINREKIASASLLANPGCYPTATILGLYPLLQMIEVDRDSLIVDAKSAVSGAGRTASVATGFCEINDNFKIYKVNQHQHIPEIEQQLQQASSSIGPIKFTTHLVPMTRGIMATIYCKPIHPITEKALQELYQQFYQEAAFVRVRQGGDFPATKDVYGSNYCDIAITYDERTGWITIVSVIDNLMKGAAGQAVQNFNLMFGIDEKTGLSGVPLFP